MHQSQRKVFMFASKQQSMASHWLNLPFYENCELCNMTFHYEFMRMLRDSSHSAWLKLVFSVNHRVEASLQDTDAKRTVFQRL